ncbi:MULTISPECIES: Wadjet anti-phage system protein JetD domain-containing protein [unclassified Crossiella]|uniref:Wadjet anti-phage system protein JetD domain-containing protein n=1 Tax=unclassified Crossiella TaxID=2620835 RepID=UPI001FFF87C8|nr:MULTISPECIES: Wadjet anti-phage system protein JetD domain-containing protein [unclassified Crossiella]MCK2241903.1 DUF2220 domain-containing protein [Crossiella sp. S99.2]MCK2255806.1 DUF2220 domain-containing protein [Crossiella sp. S99.1]
MSEELTEILPALQDNGEWRWLRTTVLDRLEEDGNAKSVVINVDDLTRREVDVVEWLLNWKPGVTGQARVQLHVLERELKAKLTNGPGLHDTLATIIGRPLADSRAQRRQDRLDVLARNERSHAALIAAISQERRLADELRHLEELGTGAVLEVPSQSRTKARSWSVYHAVLLAAVELYRRLDLGQEVSAKELAGSAWGNTKGWTFARELAFMNLIGKPLDEVFVGSDVELRLRGPLVWTADDVIADARACEPWLGLPARGIELLGELDIRAHGILIVENIDTFQRVCESDDITDRWLCVFGGGYMHRGLIRFLSSDELPKDIPIAAWGDLDAHGIHIITKASQKSGRPIHPVGMDLELWRGGKKRVQTEEQLERARQLADTLRTTAVPELRELAAEIAKTGQGCEQEPLRAQVLPTLLRQLKALERIVHQVGRV